MRYEGFLRWLAWRLPTNLVYWCAMRVIANATTGPYSNVHPDAVGAMAALDKRDHKLGGDPVFRKGLTQ